MRNFLINVGIGIFLAVIFIGIINDVRGSDPNARELYQNPLGVIVLFSLIVWVVRKYFLKK